MQSIGVIEITETNQRKIRRFKNPALVAVMARKGLNAKDLSKLTGLHHVTVGNIINNKTIPKKDSIMKITLALNVTPEEIGLA